MAFKSGIDRKEQILLPDILDDYISAENPVRVFDAFVDNLDMEECGFQKAVPKEQGRPPFNPRDLLKLYIYGYFNGVRSSRKLHKETERNMEVIWLMKKLQPDFRTIANFRRDNIKALKKVFQEFNKLCDELNLYGKEYVAVDGTKIRAQNSKDNNFTLSKVDDRIKRLNARTEEYMLQLERNDREEKDARSLSREEIEKKIQELSERKARYEGYRDEMVKNGETQKSLVDEDARLMRFSNGGFDVGFNVQTAVDSRNKLIADFRVGNKGTDHGQLAGVAEGVKEAFGLKRLEETADTGYQDKADMVRCLESGVIPNVCPNDGEDGFDLETEYEEANISGEEAASDEAETIKKCLRSGVIPEAYQGAISNIRVEEENIYETNTETGAEPEGNILDKAREGYFVRDKENDFVVCPEGNILRQKSVKNSGATRYCNKLACKECKHKCTKSKFKEVDFFPGDTTVACKAFGNDDGGKSRKHRKVIGKKKVVRFHLRIDRNKTNNRKCLSEHPFGTLKRALHGDHVLLRGLEKVGGEMALNFLTYNIKRAVNLLGTAKMLESLAI
jgi:transposase